LIAALRENRHFISLTILFADKIEGELVKTDPLRVRVSEGAATRDSYPRVPGTGAVPSATERWGEGQRSSVQSGAGARHRQAAAATQDRDRAG
jgi:hypothetical protein